MKGWMVEFNQIMQYFGVWIIGWILLGYSSIYGVRFAVQDKKTGVQKITALCGTGLIILMWLVTK